VSQNEGQKAEVDSLRILVQEQFIIFANINANVKRESLYMDRYETLLLARSRVHMDAIRAHIAEILAEEEKVAELRSDYEISYKILTPISLLFYTVLALVGVVFLFTRILLALDKSKEAEFLLSVNLEKQRLQLEIIEERKIILDEAEAIAEMGSWKWVEREDEMVWSSGLYAILDKKTDQDVSLNTFLENVIPEDTQEVERFFLEMKSKEENSTIEYRILQNNQLRYLSVTARPKSNLDKDENIVLGVVLDITENKLHEKQLQQYNAELRRSNEDLEHFAYVASHDLQEPLRKIRAFGDRLVTKFKSNLKDQGVDYITRMQAAASRMQLLIEDLLAFSRVSRAQAEFELLNPKVVLAEVMEDLDLKNKEATVRIGKMPEFYGDPMQVKRLFQNLIGNAVKFHKVNEKAIIDISGKMLGKSEVEEETGMPMPDSQYVRISIKDNGIGFDQKYAEKIFNIFQRLNGRNTYEGTGIGLAICRKIVTNHKGYIAAKSIEDVGSEFIVIFPKDLTPS
jgi:signal transduction histidine kinase